MTAAVVPGVGRRAACGAVVALAIAVTVCTAGCGYSLAGRGAFLPDYIRTIGVPLFANNTNVFDVEQTLTQQVRQEFIGRGKYRVVSDATGVDALLTGTVSSVSVSPVAFNDQQQAIRYAVVVVMKFEFRDQRQNMMLWENPSLVFREEYEVDSSSSRALDTLTFFGQEANAMQRLAEDFAKSVVTSIVVAF